MSEVFFILTTLYVAYVIFSVVTDKKKAPPKQTHVATPQIRVPPKASPAVTKTSSPIVNNPHKKNTTAVTSNSIRNPKTGEVAKIPNNYRFSKRWIKEILVTEGLLEKIYKNSELTDEVNGKIKQALVNLRGIEKYQPE
jgi:hypothetical protein